MIGVLTAVACFGLTVQNVGHACADEKPSGQIPSSLNFSPTGKEGDLVPFTFWQKIDSVNGQDMRTDYTYELFSTDKNGNRIEKEQPFPGESPEDPASDPVDTTQFLFTMSGNQTKTFYIDFTKVPLITKYLTPEYYTERDGWHFYYRSQMIKPEPAEENYTYDDIYFDVDIWIPETTITDGKLRVFCFNPLGEKVYDPGWTITADIPIIPENPDEPGNPPQTVDLNWAIAIAAIVIFGFCIALAIVDKKKKKQAFEQAAAAAGINIKKD